MRSGRFRIAGQTLEVDAEDGIDLEFEPSYARFAVAAGDGRSDDVVLRVLPPSRPPPRMAELRFRTDVWTLGRTEQGDHLCEIAASSGELLRVARFDPCFEAGEIHILPAYGKLRTEPGVAPLAHPLDQVLFANRLAARRTGVLLHAAGAVLAGRAHVFLASSGGGKSTISSVFSDDEVLSDERVVLAWGEGGELLAHGTPWGGTAARAGARSAPLGALHFLARGGVNRRLSLAPGEAARRLLHHAFPTFWDREGLAFAVELAARAAVEAACSRLEFVPGSAVRGVLS